MGILIPVVLENKEAKKTFLAVFGIFFRGLCKFLFFCSVVTHLQPFRSKQIERSGESVKDTVEILL